MDTLAVVNSWENGAQCTSAIPMEVSYGHRPQPRTYHLRRAAPPRGTKRVRVVTMSREQRLRYLSHNTFQTAVLRESVLYEATESSLKRRKVAELHENIPRLKRVRMYTGDCDTEGMQRPEKRFRRSFSFEKCPRNMTCLSTLRNADQDFSTDQVDDFLDMSDVDHGHPQTCGQGRRRAQYPVCPEVQTALLESGEVLISVARPDGTLQRVILAPPEHCF